MTLKSMTILWASGVLPLRTAWIIPKLDLKSVIPNPEFVENRLFFCIALSGKIDCLRSIEVGLNDNPEESFDIALTTTFDTFDDLRHYANHPAHLAAAAIIKEAKEARACVDYIF